MNLQEYNQVKNMTYLEYCDYLQEKYGIGIAAYMCSSWNKNQKCSRTKDGLIAHHKMEDKMILLSDKNVTSLFPFEWQQKENIVYCDYLEHLLLHVLICKYPAEDKVPEVEVGYGGVVAFLVPELNDVYSGWETSQPWRKRCHDLIRDDKDVYMEILKQFIDIKKESGDFSISDLCTSLNQSSPYGDPSWNAKKNKPLFKQIVELDK